MIEEEGPLCGHTLHVGILVLHDARHNRIVHIPQLRYPSAFVTVDEFLGRSRGINNIIRPSQELLNQFPFRNLQGFNEVGG